MACISGRNMYDQYITYILYWTYIYVPKSKIYTYMSIWRLPSKWISNFHISNYGTIFTKTETAISQIVCFVENSATKTTGVAVGAQYKYVVLSV